MRTTPGYQRGLRDLRGTGGVLAGLPIVTFSEMVGGGERDAGTVLAALRFTDVTESAGIPPGGGGGGTGSLLVVDIDGDGDLDIYAAGRLLRSHPGGFVDETAGAGLAGPVPTDAAFGDIDNDGHLDLYLARGGTGVIFPQPGQRLVSRNDGTARTPRFPPAPLSSSTMTTTATWIWRSPPPPRARCCATTSTGRSPM